MLLHAIIFINLILFQMKFINFRTKLLVFLYIVFPIVLFMVPLDWLNKQPTICLVKNIFGINCFGCGITRAVISGVQLNFTKAFEYNKMVIIVLPILIYVWFNNLRSLVQKNNVI